MVLVGSKALEFYLGDLGRVTHDFDLWMSESQYKVFKENFKNDLIKETEKNSIFEINGQIFEVKQRSQLSETDNVIFKNNAHNPNNNITVGNFILNCKVTSLKDLYVMKFTTVPFIDEPKHQHDLKLMEKHNPKIKQEMDIDFYNKRLEETRLRFENEKQVKYDFFHKYHIPEYIVHDYLHEIIANLLDIKMPTYQRITVAETDIAEDLFNKLSHEQKISLMVEESLVLALERWFVPQMIENGINHKIVENFYNNNEGFATYKILKHCCITGLKGEAEYITNFSRNNFFEIEKIWQEAKSKIKAKGGFPKEFFNQLFELREKYKSGIKVGTV